MVLPVSNKTLIRLIGVPGVAGQLNDIILSRNICEKSDNLVIFFHGDIQDYPEVMSANNNTKQFSRWNLENTATILASKFPNSVIMTIKASLMRLGVKARFDHFVETDLFGEPVFDLTTGSLIHLKFLTDEVIARSDWLLPLRCISIIGFSQGMTAVNQLIHSLHALFKITHLDYLQTFATRIRHIYWLDGGKCWLTDEEIIAILKSRNIFGHIHVTPLQVCNPERPENQINYKIFKSHLDYMRIDHVDKLYYKDTKPSFDNHFQLLEDFDP